MDRFGGAGATANESVDEAKKKKAERMARFGNESASIGGRDKLDLSLDEYKIKSVFKKKFKGNGFKNKGDRGKFAHKNHGKNGHK